MPATPSEIRARLVEAMSDPFRLQVLGMVAERPGITVKDLAARINRPPRKVRYRLEQLRNAGLVEIEQRTTTRNTRQAHYRVTVNPRFEGVGPGEDERSIALAMQRLMIGDLGLAVSAGNFGKPGRQSQYRLPGPVDQEGLEEISTILSRAAAEIEESLRANAKRLSKSDAPGIQITTNLGFFEMPPWEPTSGGGRSFWEESPPETP